MDEVAVHRLSQPVLGKGTLYYYAESWCAPVHVWRLRRCVVFGPPLRRNLYCNHKTPVIEMLRVWPPLLSQPVLDETTTHRCAKDFMPLSSMCYSGEWYAAPIRRWN
jgi:hypothetical protein